MLSKQFIVSHIYFKSLAAIDFSKCWSPVSIVVMQSKLLFTSGPFLLLKNCQFVLCYICTCYRQLDIPSILLWVVKTSPLIGDKWRLILDIVSPGGRMRSPTTQLLKPSPLTLSFSAWTIWSVYILLIRSTQKNDKNDLKPLHHCTSPVKKGLY